MDPRRRPPGSSPSATSTNTEPQEQRPDTSVSAAQQPALTQTISSPTPGTNSNRPTLSTPVSLDWENRVGSVIPQLDPGASSGWGNRDNASSSSGRGRKELLSSSLAPTDWGKRESTSSASTSGWPKRDSRHELPPKPYDGRSRGGGPHNNDRTSDNSRDGDDRARSNDRSFGSNLRSADGRGKYAEWDRLYESSDRPNDRSRSTAPSTDHGRQVSGFRDRPHNIYSAMAPPDPREKNNQDGHNDTQPSPPNRSVQSPSQYSYSNPSAFTHQGQGRPQSKSNPHMSSTVLQSGSELSGVTSAPTRPQDTEKSGRRDSPDGGSSRHDRARSRSRGRSRSRTEYADREHSKERDRSRGRAKSRVRSRSRARSKSRPRSKSRARSKSRPARRILNMGTLNLSRSLSKARKRKHRSDSDSSSSEESSMSSISASSSSSSSESSHIYSRKKRRSRKLKHKRRRRYRSPESDSNSSDISSIESDASTSHNDVPHALQKKRREQGRASQGISQLRDLFRKYDKLTEQTNRGLEMVAKLESKKQATFKQIAHMVREQQWQDIYGNHSVPPTLAGHMNDTGHIDALGQDQLMAHGQVRSYSNQSSHVGSVTQNNASSYNKSNGHSTPAKRRPDLAQIQAPSARAAPGANPGVKMEGPRMFQNNGASSSTSNPSLMEDVKPPKLRVTGYKRVFEKIQFVMPVTRQTTFSVISLDSEKTIPGAFDRRPRQLELNPYASGTEFENIAVASTLAGTLQFWDLDRQKVVLTLTVRDIRVIPYAEVVRWIAEDTLVAVSHLRVDASWPEQSSGDINKAETEIVGSSPESQATLIKIHFSRDGTLRHYTSMINAMPHTKPILSLTSVMRENHAMSFVTSGGDKRLIHWMFNAEADNENQPAAEGGQGLDLIHDQHKSAVTSLSYAHRTGILYSGARDGTYIGYDLKAEKVVRSDKYRPIYHILQNPGDPRLNLLSYYDRTGQFELLDERVQKKPVMRCGYPSEKKQSSLNNPSWHQDGALFTCGTLEEGIVNVWDIRWNCLPLDPSRRPGSGLVYGNGPFFPGAEAKHPIHRRAPRGLTIQQGSPTQILTKVGPSAVVQALFHPTKNKMLFVNKDCSMSFHDYHLVHENLE